MSYFDREEGGSSAPPPKKRKPYASMYGKGPILINEDEPDTLQKDELMNRSRGLQESTPRPGSEQRERQAQTMAKAGNADAKEFLKNSNIVEEAKAPSSEEEAGFWAKMKNSVPKKRK